jgi:cell division protein FtsI/penicillin-binding protein 2
MVIFVARLFYLQVIRHGYYVAQADQEQLKQYDIPAKRGLIYGLDHDRPTPLVMNETVYTVFADPSLVSNKQAVVAAVKETAGGNTRDGFETLLDRKDSRYQVIATKLTRVQADALKEKDLAGIGFTEETQRVYPEGALAGQILGFVNAEGKGNYGVEAGMNTELTGTPGQLRTVTDIRDVPLTIGDQNVNIPAKDGENVVLSIDTNIQNHVEEALKAGLEKINATNGSVLVMNPNNGQVMAMANYPSYSPAEFSKVTDASVFNNATISVPYEPASVMKTFTMATGVEKGVMTPQSTYTNTGSVTINDDGCTFGCPIVNNATKTAAVTGVITMQDVLNNSLNTGTVTIARWLGDGKQITKSARQTLYDFYYNKFGLGQFTGIELANESPGIVVSPDTTEGNAVRYSNMTFGQGLDITMLQVAAGFSSIINGGSYYKPTVVAGVLNDDGTMSEKKSSIERQTISLQTSATMRTMLQAARGSVSYMRASDRPGYTFGGKTGTAETLRNGVYTQKETVGTYLGYGGTDMPEYVIMVQVSAPNRNLEGGIHAEPIFADISNWMIDYLGLPPKG